ncbi:ribosomal-processing cysteine protease Prp [Lactiplantibacillus paraxiangfangensis]|uniref:ribosomal-processing cysteine protease Prp n=1 Tax=Lactiplantibacillus paraxiangfangensis TaxID=3076224 RepID=UPI0030C6BC2F
MGYQIVGHAGQASKGYDIVCAAVSALTETITNELSHATVSDDGGLFVGLIFPSKANDLLTRTLFHGLKSISEQYPSNLRVIVHE